MFRQFGKQHFVLFSNSGIQSHSLSSIASVSEHKNGGVKRSTERCVIFASLQASMANAEAWQKNATPPDKGGAASKASNPPATFNITRIVLAKRCPRQGDKNNESVVMLKACGITTL
ncbi:MAG: hypothetical protein EZS28_046258 [Streblomastix strix]|uniref:Uncharacterized protein n=1 Tax=Streblomastix strix TaxID=222440 RepID=A0A5J4TIF9_9EUKA|nr:MAG: hypothetical protein EZS28_046258 [Streblomastix strix]